MAKNKIYKNKIYVFILIAYIIPSYIFAQSPIIQEDQIDFVYKVSQIDEFFDRFNFDKTNRLVSFFKKENLPIERLNRKILLSQLFDNQNNLISEQLKIKFISEINDSIHPQFIHFYDKNWFAEVKTSIEFKGKSQNLILYMQNEIYDDNHSKWVIAGVKADFLDMPKVTDSTYILH